MYISLEQAETLVELNDNIFWDGWNLVFFNPHIDGFMRQNGMFKNNKWGVKTTQAPGKNGYFVEPRYAKFLNTAKNRSR